MAIGTPRGTVAAAPKGPPRGRAPGDRAAAVALAPLASGEAPRIGVLGDSGTGKTHANAKVVTAYLRASPGIVLVVDDKELRARFAGQERRDVDELSSRPPDGAGLRVLVFRGCPREAVEVDPETVAALAWRLVGRGQTVLVVYDELDKAAAYGQWKRGVVKIPKSFGQGRAVGIASLWGTQSPQAVPREAFEQSSCIMCFRLAGRGLALLGERDYLEGVPPGLIESFPGDEVPPAQRGDFVLLRRGRPWDGLIYRF